MASCASKGKNQVLIQAIFGCVCSFSRGKVCSFLQTLPIHIINACVMLAMLKIIVFENNYTLTWNTDYMKLLVKYLRVGLFICFQQVTNLLKSNQCTPVHSFMILQDEFCCDVCKCTLLPNHCKSGPESIRPVVNERPQAGSSVKQILKKSF